MKLVLALTVLLCSAMVSQAQPAKKSTLKKPAVAVKKKPVAPQPRPERIPIEERMSLNAGADSTYIYTAATGDTLVYEVIAGDNMYDFTVALTAFDGGGKGIAFGWTMSDPVNRQGKVKISKNGYLNSSSYINRFSGGELNLANACTVFMTAKNFGEMPAKKTKMTIDGVTEMFYRPTPDEVPVTIMCKGKEYKSDGFKVTNNDAGDGDKVIVTQNTSGTPLILQMMLGFSIRLKEIK
jgi:hypothetical protein